MSEYDNAPIQPGYVGGAPGWEQRGAGVNEHDNAASAQNKIDLRRREQEELNELRNAMPAAPSSPGFKKWPLVFGVCFVIGALIFGVDAYRNPYKFLLSFVSSKMACNAYANDSDNPLVHAGAKLLTAIPEYADVKWTYDFDTAIGTSATGNLTISYKDKSVTQSVSCGPHDKAPYISVSQKGGIDIPAEYRQYGIFALYAYLTGIRPEARLAEIRNDPARANKLCAQSPEVCSLIRGR